MFVVTADQRASRASADRVPDLLRHYRDLPVVRGFERTAGDEVEAVFDDPAIVGSVVVDWSLPVLVGGHRYRRCRSTASTTDAEAGRGRPSKLRAQPSKRRKDGAYRCRSSDRRPGAYAQTAACLLVDLVASRSEAGCEAVALVAAGDSQASAAKKLGISPQAMSLRLRAARWDLQPDSQTLVTELLRRCEEDR